MEEEKDKLLEIRKTEEERLPVVSEASNILEFREFWMNEIKTLQKGAEEEIECQQKKKT